MKRVLSTSFSILVIFLCASAARADLRIKQRSTIGSHTSETTVAIKGARQRYEIEAGGGSKMINLSQCDLKRTVSLNEASKRYMVTRMDGETEATGGAQAPTTGASVDARRGGVITYTDTLTDTKERKLMFGLQARHIKTVTQVSSDANACSPVNQREETDGWYIDLDMNYSCQTGADAARNASAPARQGCQDRIQRKQIGTAKLGYPVLVTRTTYGADGQVQSQMTTEVLELSRVALDQALFEVPADYTEAKSFQEMYAPPLGAGASADAAEMSGAQPGPRDDNGATSAAAAALNAKRPGTLRVGVVGIINRAEREISTTSLHLQLVTAINDANVDAVALSANAPAAIEAEAQQRGCDFILYTDITSLKTSAAKKLGGMFGKAAGLGAAGLDKTESRVEFRLMTMSNNATPQMQSTATAKEEGDETSVAAALKKEAQMVLTEALNKRSPHGKGWLRREGSLT